MSALDAATFIVKYNDGTSGLFKANITQNRSTLQDRTLVQDVADSFYNSVDYPLLANSIFRGAYDASTNLFPAAGLGSGVGGAIRAGDEWYFSVAGTLDGGLWPIGTIAKALVDAPGQTTTNWRLI
jgi:hypothetical protein